MFDARVFKAEKQPDDVRRSYIEVQLQRLMMQAHAQACEAVLDRLDRLGEEDQSLGFTLYGFGSFMRTPHFQFYLALIEAACNKEKDARKRWTKVSKLPESLPSREFPFPLLAASKLDSEGAKPRIAAALQSVRAALSKADGESKMSLMYAEGMLLRVSNQADQAAERLQAVVEKSKDVHLRYLAQTELREMLAANQ